MGLVPVRAEHFNPVQKAFVKRRRQLKAIFEWLSDLKDGQDQISLKTYCEFNGVDTRGIQKLLKSDRVQEVMQETIERSARQGVKLATSLLVKRLETEGVSMKTTDAAKVIEVLSRVSSGAYQNEGKAGATVAVQINLPSIPGHDKESRTIVVKEAQEKLEGLV